MVSPNIVVLSAPSGAGKTSLAELLLLYFPLLERSISSTTRSPRKGEKDGRDYYFLEEKEFIQRKEKGEFIEYAFVYGCWYGTFRKTIEEIARMRKIALLVIDTQGGLQVKQVYSSAFLIGVLPPSVAEQKSRLLKRGDSLESIESRIAAASKERRILRTHYDIRVVNKNLDQTALRLVSLIKKRFFLS
jgi:guanylate kinase